jgi:hypothetical protein
MDIVKVPDCSLMVILNGQTLSVQLSILVSVLPSQSDRIHLRVRCLGKYIKKGVVDAMVGELCAMFTLPRSNDRQSGEEIIKYRRMRLSVVQ